MKKNATLIVVLVIAAIFIVSSLFALFKVVQFVRHGIGNMSGDYIDEAKLQLPTQVPANSLAVFNFRHTGDSDAKLYAIGFARALADRLHCAPTCVTQQQGITTISCALEYLKHNSRVPASDETALKTNRSLAVRYILTGDFELKGSEATIRVYLHDTRSKSGKTTFTVTGSVSDLTGLQTQLVGKITSAMNLKPSGEQLSQLQKANFTNSRTLITYGRSFLSTDFKQTESLRWDAVRYDPNSSFAVIRLLEYYHYGPATGLEIARNTPLQELIKDSEQRFANNSHIHVLTGSLLVRQFRYEAAEKVLTDLVRKDPQMAWGHSALRWVACCRENGDLAVQEAERAVEIWPNNPYFHAMLADAHGVASQNARHGHYFGDMSRSVEAKWRENCQSAMREALIATKIDPACSEGWGELDNVSRQLGVSKYADRSFEERIRINPKNMGAYLDYAFGYSPQWGGTDSDQQKIVARAESAFGKGSMEIDMMRAQILISNQDSTDKSSSAMAKRQEIMRLTQQAISKSKSPEKNESLMLLKCRALLANKQRAEMAKVAQQGFEKWGSPTWRHLYGMGCAFLYEDKHDRKYLDKAEELYRVYAREIPFDTRGHIQWGWCLSHQGHREEAKREFLKALELDPANELAKEKLTYVQ